MKHETIMKPFKKCGISNTLHGTENDAVLAASFRQSHITMSTIVVMISLQICMTTWNSVLHIILFRTLFK